MPPRGDGNGDGDGDGAAFPAAAATSAAAAASAASTPAASTQFDLVGFTLIVDDTVHPDGTTSMEQVGGGGPQTLWGFQLQRGGRARVGLAAGVGADMPASVRAWLAENIACDLSGLVVSSSADADAGPLPTPRAWQVMDWDGRRTQVWRSPECDALYGQLRPGFDELPEGYRRAARSYHLGIHAAHPPMKLLARLGGAARRHEGGLLSVETYTSCDEPLLPGRREELSALLGVCDVFSPNEGEAWSIVGGRGGSSSSSSSSSISSSISSLEQQHEMEDAAALALVEQLISLGASIVLLRRGERGVLAADASTGDAVFVPAVAGTRVVDVVGCGNACCGAFLAAMGSGLSLAESAAWGCAAGSVMAEHTGVPRAAVDHLRVDAARRQAAALALARPARLSCAAAPRPPSRAAALRVEAFGGSRKADAVLTRLRRAAARASRGAFFAPLRGGAAGGFCGAHRL